MGTNYTQCVHRIRLRPVVPQHQPEDLENIDPSKFETDPSLGKYRSEPGLFDDSLPKLLDDIQTANGGQSNLPDAPARIRLSVPLGGPAAAPIAPAAVPIPAAAPIVALPPPALPPDPDPEPLVPPEFEYNDGLINDETMNDAAVTMPTTVNLGNDGQNMAQETSRTKRKAAVEARDKMFCQTRFSKRCEISSNTTRRIATAKIQPTNSRWTRSGSSNVQSKINPKREPLKNEEESRRGE